MKKDISNQIAFSKYVYRKMLCTRESMIQNIRDAKREKRLLSVAETARFNKHKIAEIDQYLSFMRENYNVVSSDILELSRHIYELLKLYEETDATLHEKAQLLSINHIHLERIENVEKYTLVELAFVHHAEISGEKDEFVGHYGKRDSPLFWAIETVFREEMYSNKQLQEKSNEIFSEIFGALPTYTAVTYADGSTEMIRNSPNLKLINGGSS